MNIHTLNKKNTILNQFLSEIRDKEIQQDRWRFRQNLRRIGWLMAYEISMSMAYEKLDIETPLGKAVENVPKVQPYLINILRAAMPFFQGFQDVFDHADGGFIGAFRAGTEGNEFDIAMNYEAIDSLGGKDVIIIDPMLATGKSLIQAINRINTYGQPASLHVATIISAQKGIENLESHHAKIDHFWTLAVDDTLNAKYYIVPGLGDAGDLSFGPKKS